MNLRGSAHHIIYPKLAEPTVDVDKSDLPKIRQSERIRLVVVVHPFYHTQMNGGLKGESPSLPIRSPHQLRTGDLKVHHEFDTAEKKRDVLATEAKHPNSAVIFVANRVTEDDFSKLAQMDESKRKSFFRKTPTPSNSKRLSKKAAQAGLGENYEELWLASKALDGFGAERVLFHNKESWIDSRRLYSQLGSKRFQSSLGVSEGENPQFEGVLMGTYLDDCVKSIRRDIGYVTNQPEEDFTVYSWAGLGMYRPTNRESHDVHQHFPLHDPIDGNDQWKTYIRSQIAAHRASMKPDRMSLVDPAAIRTYDRNTQYLRERFSRYTVSSLNTGGLSEEELRPNRRSLPLNNLYGSILCEFLEGKHDPVDAGPDQQPDAAEKELPWRAGPEEYARVKLELASYLAGRKIGSEEFPGFVDRYKQLMTDKVLYPWARSKKKDTS